MPLHPIAVVDHVIEEYRSYLRTEFRARDPELRAALEAAIDRPLFLAGEPFFQAHRPFAPGARWQDLGLDARLARVMREDTGSETSYHHQGIAIGHLFSRDATPLVVATGTGSGKTECFLLPVIQNAIEDATAFAKSGLTAILVYPMNALANDQEERIGRLLEASGHTHLKVARYDRQTSEEERARLRQSPPHVLLTNYVMLEYLLVRPADREALFANHRVRYVVLDEVHSYRGALGTNIALLFRRLLAHLREARQDWKAEQRQDPARFPRPVPVATSATIKSVDEAGRSEAEIERLRDEAVQEFFGKLTGVVPATIRVVGERLQSVAVPAEARWTPMPAFVTPPEPHDPAAVRQTLAALAGLPEDAPLRESAGHARLLWTLNELLARKPMSVSGIVEQVRSLPERATAGEAAVRAEVEAALVAGAALPDGTPGQLRLRSHRFVRGGWSFHRCVDPACGRLYASEVDACGSCGKKTAPLYLCRSCGADVLRFRGDPKDPTRAPLQPNDTRASTGEWLLYAAPQPGDLGEDDEGEAEGLVGTEREMRDRPVLAGSFDPDSCSFSSEAGDYPVRATLAPARNRCLVCGSRAGGGSILTPVGLGTSAAVRVLAEGLTEALADENKARPRHDGKERLLVFADSRQDAAHQARFVTYAGRYDRMRRRLVRALGAGPLTLEQAIQALLVEGVARRDNPVTEAYDEASFLNADLRARAEAWEAAPLLDDLAISAGYRATALNLGLVGLRYPQLAGNVERWGASLCADLGLSPEQLTHLCRCLLDEMRRRGALSHPLLTCHPDNAGFPKALLAADWERRAKAPNGYAFDEQPASDRDRFVAWRDQDSVPAGIKLNNAWRRARTGGLGPSLERRFRHLLARLGGLPAKEVTAEHIVAVIRLLAQGPRLVHPVRLLGWRQTATLLQVNAGCVELVRLEAHERFRCSVCNVRMPWVRPGDPCPVCHGSFVPWPAAEVAESRAAQRILNPDLMPLVAAEHTAQVPGRRRAELEQAFKAAPGQAPLNVLCCSPTLEMGIDIGGLDAVILRNIPPRPDNYAQRGGRAGRQSRVGIVVGYTRSTPHDGYFFDRPQEMIAGEVRSPGVGLGNRDVVLRHLHAIAFGGAEPGLAGRMVEYVTPRGELVQESVEALIEALRRRFPEAAVLALSAWGPEVLGPLGLDRREALLLALQDLPARIREVFDSVRRQVCTLNAEIGLRVDLSRGGRSVPALIDLRSRLLGLPAERDRGQDADDRSAGQPMRRFAEHGILPGYEFPAEPCTLRLLNDADEQETISVERRFGLSQYQPEAKAHARGHRWRVVGLDPGSPWNPKTQDPSWIYVRCRACGLRYDPQQGGRCPRCGSCDAHDRGGPGYPAFEYAGFVAVRDDTPVLEEEDRFAIAALVQCHPQHDGHLVRRLRLATGWAAALRHEESVRWVNEWKAPTGEEQKYGAPRLDDDARGFWLCGACGRALEWPKPAKEGAGRKRASKGKEADPHGHGIGCVRAGQPPEPHAITACSKATTLRIEVVLPRFLQEKEYAEAYPAWGQSLGYALRTGLRHLYMLDGSEIDFELEPPYEREIEGLRHPVGTLTFIDAAVGGSGFLDRAAAELHLVARAALEHLDHRDCETACYRCLKSYQNQRVHHLLHWPLVMPDLTQLATAAPEPLPPERGDADDPRPWLEAYDAGVGSPLELRFLRLFESRGVEVDKQVRVAAEEGGRFVSVADFVLRGEKVAIYVDGAAFHRGARLRRDRAIRRALREGSAGWRVVELTAGMLGDPEGVVRAVRGG